jgi:8-oxo-dGTP pyrophosphatase MutT (NUDIX family)
MDPHPATDNPWKTLSTEVKYRNPWFSVREDQVIRPDGKPGIYGVVETRIATGVVALTPLYEVYLVGQFRYPTNMYSWEIPEGGTDGNEEPLAAARRELQEETGLTAARWSPLGHELHMSNCISSERAFLFLAQELTQSHAEPEGTEVLAVRREPLAQCLRMIASGEIVDALSIIALLHIARRLRV